jgi:predicted membrane protein
MTFVQAPLGNHREESSDDMNVEILLLGAIGITAPIILQTGNPDMFAIPGAILAAVVALLKANSEKRDWSQKGIVVVGTTVIGSTGPAAVVHWWYPEAITKLIPQAHALLGFLSGLLGWLLFWAGYMILDRRKETVMKAAIKEAERRMGVPRIPDDEPQP